MPLFPFRRKRKPAPALLADVRAWVEARFAPEEPPEPSALFEMGPLEGYEDVSYSMGYAPMALEERADEEAGFPENAAPSATPSASPAPSVPSSESYATPPMPDADASWGDWPEVPSYPLPGSAPASAPSQPSYGAPMPQARQAPPGQAKRRGGAAPSYGARTAPVPTAGELFRNMDASFSDTLLALVDARGLSDPQVYRAAGMSRQHFSKIRSDASYRPTKRTVLALAIALELDLPETQTLLERAGFALSHASKQDLVVEYCVTHGIYDIMQVDALLYAFDLPTIGS